MRLLISIMIFLMYSTAAFAFECNQYINKVVIPTQTSKLIGILKKIPNEKSEFETTEEYNKRKENLISTIKNKAYVVDLQINKDALHYNADTQTIPFNKNTLLNYIHNNGLLISLKEIDYGKYIGSNAFNAKVVVKEFTRKTQSIYDKNLLMNQPDEAVTLYEMKNISASQAKQVKSDIKLAAVMDFKEPYYTKEESWHKPMYDFPYDVYNYDEKIYGNIKCILIQNSKRKVLGTVELNKPKEHLLYPVKEHIVGPLQLSLANGETNKCVKVSYTIVIQPNTLEPNFDLLARDADYVTKKIITPLTYNDVMVLPGSDQTKNIIKNELGKIIKDGEIVDVVKSEYLCDK